MERKRYLDIAKGIAIILVVTGHLIDEKVVSFAHSDYVLLMIYNFHMPVFFFISGILMAETLDRVKKKEELLKHYARSLVKLLLIFVILSGLYILLMNPGSTEEVLTQLRFLFTLRGRAPIWFMSALFLSELTVYMIYKFQRNTLNTRRNVAIVLVATFLLSFVAYGFCADRIAKDSISGCLFNTVIRYFVTTVFLLIGFLAGKYINMLKPSVALFALAAAITSVFGVLVLKLDNSVNVHLAKFGTMWKFYLLSVLGSVSLILISRTIESIYSFPVLSYLGRATLIIMIVHYKPFNTMNFARLLSVKFSEGTFLNFLATLVIVLIICSLVNEMYKVISGKYKGKSLVKEKKENTN